MSHEPPPARVNVRDPAFWALIHAELRRLAEGIMGREERAGHTLQPTALVNEAYLRLTQQRNLTGVDRKVFFGAAANTMRKLLIDHAKRRDAVKRGGGLQRCTLTGVDLIDGNGELDVLDLDEAITDLERADPRAAQIVVMRFFTGMEFSEIAAALDLGERTVYDDWKFARAWLRKRLAGKSREGSGLST